MKAKIFSKLKQAYSDLGLGDEILQGRADSLAKTGLVTDENIDYVVSVQKDELAAMQKQNDKRVQDALAKQKAKFDEESRKREAEAAEAAEKAKSADAEAAKKKAEEEEARKAADAEAAKKKAEEEAAEKEAADKEAQDIENLRKQALSEDVLKYLETMKANAAKERKSFEATISKMAAENAANVQKQMEVIKQLQEANTALQTGYDSIVKESEAAKAAQAAAERSAFIVSKAKELGIPEWRIKEGFVIGDDADNDAISEILSNSANNLKTEMLPAERPSFNMGSSNAEDTKAMIEDIVKRQIG